MMPLKRMLPLILLILCSFQSRAQLYFPPTSGSTWDTMSFQQLGWCQEKVDSLNNFLETNNSKAFILLKDGKIVLEEYYNGHTANSLWQWASAGKTITSFMVGMAQQEGYLNISDTTSQYLGQGWTNCTPAQEEKITIRHQLTMTSGLDDGVQDIYCTLDTCLEYLTDPGTRWAYHNGPYTLLDSVIEGATGTGLNSYTTQKLKTPTGMTGLFYYVGYNNVFFSNARSMARFGLLMLNNGNWNGNQIMTDNNYFSEMINTSQSINLSYGYLWWLNGKSSCMLPQSQFVFPTSICPNAPTDMYAALGKDGQIINVVPSMNLVWIRMGEAPGSGASLVANVLSNDIWGYLNDMECTAGISEEEEKLEFSVYPNPTKNEFNVSILGLKGTDLTLSLHDLQGRKLLQLELSSATQKINLNNIPSGTYLINVSDGVHLAHQKITIEK